MSASPAALSETAAPPPTDAGLARSVVRGGTIFLTTRLFTQLILWSVTLLVAKLLRPFDYGVMTSGVVFVGLADLLAEAGVGRALVQKKDLTGRIVDEIFTTCIGLSVLLYAAVFFSAHAAADFLQTPELASFLRVLALTTLLIPWRTVPLALLERDLALGRQSAVHVGSSLVQAAVVLGLAWAGFGYWALASGVVVGRFLEAIALCWASGWRPRLAIPGAGARSILVFGLHVSLSGFLWFAYSNSDFAVVGKFIGQEALGLYALAFQLMSLPVQKLTANVNQVVYAAFCRLQDERPRLRDWYLRLNGLLGFVGIPMLAGMALVAADGIPLILGAKWEGAIRPFCTLCVVGMIMLLTATLPPLLNALGRPDLNLKYSLAQTLVLPAGFVVGASLRGLDGVSIAWLILYPPVAAAFFVCTRHVTGIGLLDMLRTQRLVLAAVILMSGVVLALTWALSGWESAAGRLTVLIAAGALTYAGVILLVGRKTLLADVRAFWRELRGARAEPELG